MAAKRKVQVEIPGTLPDEREAEADLSEASVVPLNGQAKPEPATDSAMNAQQEQTLKEQLVAVAALRGSPAALDWGHLSGAGAIAGDQLDPNAGLPDFADPLTITAPVLTKAGWVMPANDPRVRFGQR